MLLTHVPGFPGSPEGKESACRPGFSPWVGKISLEKGMATHSSVLAWKIPMGRGARRATVHGVTESDTTDRLTVTLGLQPLHCAQRCRFSEGHPLPLPQSQVLTLLQPSPGVPWHHGCSPISSPASPQP